MKATKEGIFRAVIVSLRSAGFLVVAGALVLGWNGVLRAQTAELQLVPSNSVPHYGTFWSIQRTNYPPLPLNPYPQLDVYTFSDRPGRYWYDDRAVDYAALWEQNQVDSALRSLERQYGPESPEEGPLDYPEGSLWLSLGQLTNGFAPLTIHGTAQDVLYEVLSKPTLTNAGWASEGAVLGAASQDWTPAAITVGDRTNRLFFQARSWTDCDAYGVPWAWYAQHGLYPVTPDIGMGDADEDGLLNWQEYRYGSDPQVSEGFSVWVSSPAGYSGIP